MKIGLQMYSVRQHMSEAPLDTTRAVIELGYRHLEFANLTEGSPGVGFDVDPGELRELVTASGAEVVSTHVWPLDEHNLEEVIEFHAELGTRYLVSKFLPATPAEALESVPRLRLVGERLREHGIGHLLHNGLLRATGDRTELDLLLEQVPADLLALEVDTYWVHRSGIDPVELIKRYGERIAVLHQKDLPAEIRQPVDIVSACPEDQPITIESVYTNPQFVGEDNFTEIGRGVLPVQQIIDSANAHTRAEFIFVEQDYTELDELDSVGVSLRALQSCEGVQ